MKRNLALLFVCTFLGSACMPVIREIGPALSRNNQPGIAGLATETPEISRDQNGAQSGLTPYPDPAVLPIASPSHKLHQSSLLGIQFTYPDGWYIYETLESQDIWGTNNAQIPAIILTSFDPANPPHKLEWTAETIRAEIRLLPAGSVPQTLNDWVESAKQTAETAHLTIFEEHQFNTTNQPATRLTLVSGSGGTIHQILTILDGRAYEIYIEGNINLGISVLNTMLVYSSSGLKLAESNTPAAGICLETQDEIVPIVLGLDQGGMPQAGRCVSTNLRQRIKLINQSSKGPFAIKFADYSIELQVGDELLLDRPVGEYLAPGAHTLPMGPVLWVKAEESTISPVATMPGPLRNYSNLEVGFSLTLQSGWNVDEHGLVALSKEVIFYPSDAEPFVAYLSILLDSRTLDQITDAYAQTVPDAVREETIFNGLTAVKYTYPFGRQEYFIPYENRIILISTDKPNDGNVQQMISSITFTTPSVTRYTNQDLGYSLTIPLNWVVDENGLTALSKEVRIFPVNNVEPFLAYLDIGLDPRTLEMLKAQNLPTAKKEDIFFAGMPGVQYRHASGRIEIYLDYHGQVYYLISDTPTSEEVQIMIDSFVFIDAS